MASNWMQEGDGAYGTGAGLCVLFSRRKSGKKCRNIAEKSMNLGMYQSVRDLYSHHSWKSPMQKICRDMEECHISFYGDAGWSLYAEKK